MYVCFAEPTRQFSGFRHTLTAVFTGGRYCHVCVVFEIPNSTGNIEFQECSILHAGAHSQDVVHTSVVENMDGWTVYELKNKNILLECEVFQWARDELVGRHYDVFAPVWQMGASCGCIGGFARESRAKNGKLFCSSLAMAILQRAGLYVDHAANEVSPNDLARMIKQDEGRLWRNVTKNAQEIFGQRSFYVPFVGAENRRTHGYLVL